MRFLLIFCLAGLGFGQGSAVPVDWAKRVPNISIRVDMTGGASERRVIAPGLRQQSGRTETRAAQFVTVANGAHGSIEVARRVPYLEWLTTFGRNWAPPDDSIDFKWDKVGAYMNVHAQTAGSVSKPWVYITLTPELRGVVDGRPERVMFTRASTRVVAANGRTLPVGAAGRATAFYDKFLTSYSAGTVIEPVRISVTPTLMFAPSQQPAGPRQIVRKPLGPPISELRIKRPPLPEIPKMRMPNWVK